MPLEGRAAEPPPGHAAVLLPGHAAGRPRGRPAVGPRRAAEPSGHAAGRPRYRAAAGPRRRAAGRPLTTSLLDAGGPSRLARRLAVGGPSHLVHPRSLSYEAPEAGCRTRAPGRVGCQYASSPREGTRESDEGRERERERERERLGRWRRLREERMRVRE